VGLGHRNVAPENRSYLVRLVEMRTGLSASDADNRVAQIMSKARDAVAKARRSAGIVAFIVGASLLLGAAAACSRRPTSRQWCRARFLASMGCQPEIYDAQR